MSKQIKKEVAEAYHKYGQATAFDVANKHGVGYEFCKGCETDSLAINHECLICGQTTTERFAGFTPGKWEIDTDEKYVSKYRIYSTADGSNVGWFDPDEENIEQGEANAALISAATELLRENEDLKETIKLLHEKSHVILNKAANNIPVDAAEYKSFIGAVVTACGRYIRK